MRELPPVGSHSMKKVRQKKKEDSRGGSFKYGGLPPGYLLAGFPKMLPGG
jgi:hypothetical protein